MNIAHSLTDLIGNTPLLALERALPNTRVLGKLECMNPLSSAKDRARGWDQDRRCGRGGPPSA